ncbi:MAG: hypothetical protein Q7S22_02990 [Candidatus Micrarchaeota archaeon]|nr:hypothetical protein [Candidatus Micrarchaeota archaeon]
MIQPLILLVSVFYLLLWGMDLYLTLKSTSKMGHDLEINPIMNFFLRARRRYLALFKISELVVFFILILSSATLDLNTAIYILLGWTIIFSIVVAQGVYIYILAGGDPKPIAIGFLSISLLTVLFIFTSFSTFSDNKLLSSAFGSCNDQIVSLQTQYKNCNDTIAPVHVVQNTNSDLNFTIPR